MRKKLVRQEQKRPLVKVVLTKEQVKLLKPLFKQAASEHSNHRTGVVFAQIWDAKEHKEPCFFARFIPNKQAKKLIEVGERCLYK